MTSSIVISSRMKIKNLPFLIILSSWIAATPIGPRPGWAQQLETLNASYASVTGSRIPLWVAKDAGLFERYGLNVNLVVIAAGTAAIGALMGGDVEILGAPGSTTMVSAAKGMPLAIIGTFGPGAWKLIAHPSIHRWHSCAVRPSALAGWHDHRIRHAARVGETWTYAGQKTCRFLRPA